VIEANGVGKSYEGRPIIDNFSMRVQRGDRIGIVGPNGSGKTTLINLLTGALEPDTGSVRLGANLAIATLNQHRDSLDGDTTVAEALTAGGGDTVHVNGQAKHVVSYMKDFLFTAEQARTPLRKLSGGERGRLMLAQALAKPSNLLVLDEPTNDLDMETLEVLEEMLGDYRGTVLLISHDRDFLDRLVNGVIAPEGNGRWIEYAGGYSDMLAQRGADLRCQGPSPRFNPRPRRCRRSSPIPSSTRATAPDSRRSAATSATCSARSPRRRNNGWRLRFCGRNSPAGERVGPNQTRAPAAFCRGPCRPWMAGSAVRPPSSNLWPRGKRPSCWP
jgi:ATP-binding cassette subfamily F protein uup